MDDGEGEGGVVLVRNFSAVICSERASAGLCDESGLIVAADRRLMFAADSNVDDDHDHDDDLMKDKHFLHTQHSKTQDIIISILL